MDKLLKLSLTSPESPEPQSEHERDNHDSQSFAPFVIRYCDWKNASGLGEDRSCAGKTSYTLNVPAYVGETTYNQQYFLYVFTGHTPCTAPTDLVGCPGVRFYCSGAPDWINTECFNTSTAWHLRMFIRNNETKSPRSATLTLTQQQTNATITVTVNQEGQS